jgi:3-hydroxyisobutyrate dehydrogenase-like beta-hydroxyacid dehydrogenase
MPKKSRKNVGLIGLGIIGSRVASALRSGGFHVYVWNRTPRAAPNFLASPRQVAELCNIVQIFVADAQALFDVLESMGDAITPSHTILCCATVGPEATLDAARIVHDRGAQFLDAPFTGSKMAAQNRELIYFIGGDDKALATAEPVLKVSSKAIVKIGKIGDAAVIKVATNMISAVTVQTLAEAYAIVKDSGIDPRTLGEALKHHAVRSGITDAKFACMLDRNYEAHFSLKHMFKDVQLGIHIANSLDIDLPATTSTAGVMYGGLTRGWGDEDFSVLARNYQKEDAPAAGGLPPVTPPGNVAPPILMKKEAPREASASELRDVGIKLPDSAGVAADGAVSSKVDGPKAVDAAPAAPVVAVSTVAGDKGSATTEAEGLKGANGAPESPDAPESKERPPFVRIRRWFGTGSAT